MKRTELIKRLVAETAEVVSGRMMMPPQPQEGGLP